MKEHIFLYISGETWMMKTDCPKILGLFNTDTIPTAFTSACPAALVEKRIRTLNPDATITIDMR